MKNHQIISLADYDRLERDAVDAIKNGRNFEPQRRGGGIFRGI